VGREVDTVIVENRIGSANAVRELIVRVMAHCGARERPAPADDAEWIAGSPRGRAGIAEDPALVPSTAPTATPPGQNSPRCSPPPIHRRDLRGAQRRGARRDPGESRRARVATVVFDEGERPRPARRAALVIQSDPTRLGRVAAEMALERLDGLAGPARLVVHKVGRHDVAQEIAR
jgi:hypothetical protein